MPGEHGPKGHQIPQPLKAKPKTASPFSPTGWAPTGLEPPPDPTPVGAQPSGRTWPEGPSNSAATQSQAQDGSAVFAHGVGSYRARASAGPDSCRSPALWANMARKAIKFLSHSKPSPRRLRRFRPRGGLLPEPPLDPTPVGAQPSGRTWPEGPSNSAATQSQAQDGSAVFAHGVGSYRARASAGPDSCRSPALWANMARRAIKFRSHSKPSPRRLRRFRPRGGLLLA